MVTVHFRSDPTGAAVYPRGARLRTCVTPCQHTISLSDGGSPDRRDFVLRRAGYRDEQVVVSLKKPEATVSAVLERRVRSTRGPVKATKRTDRPTRPAVQPKPKETAKSVTPKPKSGAKTPSGDGKKVRKPPKKGPRSGTISPSDTLNPFEKK
jgi:hypothetical protein